MWPLRYLRAWLIRKIQGSLDWLTAVALRQMGRLASKIQPLIYSLFHRLPKGHSAPIDVGSSQDPDTTFTTIEHRDHDWRYSRVAPLVENSQSRFLLFCQRGHIENLDDLLPLFEDPLTFAVTRQTGFREWRSITIALSPFRPLAPKEISRVAAPLGPAVLVDRKKLLQLPLPKTLVFDAAWLILFWRAGAAGWRSYSVGATTPVSEQPDYFLPEMFFIYHLCLDRDLRVLTDGAPKLCRGNIAFRPDLTRPYRSLPRVLVVAPYLPFPPSHGGAVRVYNLCKALADRIDFIYICFRGVSEVVNYEEMHAIFLQVYVVDRDEVHHNQELPELVNMFESSSMRELVATVAREQSVELLQIEWTDMAGYRETAPQVPAILVEHDITYTLYRQLAEWDDRPKLWREYERWLRFEMERLPAFDGVFAVSEDNKEEAIRAGSNGKHTYVIPNGVDLDRYRALPPSAQSAGEILYVGSFRHQPNLLGFDELRTRIMPRVWERFPHAILRVAAGLDYEKHWRNALKGSATPNAAIPLLDPRIIIHDFVPDLLPFYETAHVVVVPLTLAAGTSIKVMEALACQRAVVTTPVGARGLGLESSCDAVICELGDGFADAICKLLENPALRDEIARRGRVTAEARFGWDISAREALDAYSLMIRESREQRASDDERRAQGPS
jgi:polysaccharide biosynthesis protein PslH